MIAVQSLIEYYNFGLYNNIEQDSIFFVSNNRWNYNSLEMVSESLEIGETNINHSYTTIDTVNTIDTVDTVDTDEDLVHAFTYSNNQFDSKIINKIDNNVCLHPKKIKENENKKFPNLLNWKDNVTTYILPSFYCYIPPFSKLIANIKSSHLFINPVHDKNNNVFRNYIDHKIRTVKYNNTVYFLTADVLEPFIYHRKNVSRVCSSLDPKEIIKLGEISKETNFITYKGIKDYWNMKSKCFQSKHIDYYTILTKFIEQKILN